MSLLLLPLIICRPSMCFPRPKEREKEKGGKRIKTAHRQTYYTGRNYTLDIWSNYSEYVLYDMMIEILQKFFVFPDIPGAFLVLHY
jgi:hypothetical protein